MSSPYLAEITMFGGNFAPRSWAFCSGQNISIAQNTALFALLGTTYGGNGQTTFALPNLQGRVSMHPGQGPGLSNYVLGEQAGTETVTLLNSEMPAHLHASATSAGGTADSPQPVGRFPATPVAGTPYADTGGASMAGGGGGIALTGGNQGHNNIMPCLGVNFIIATEGIFPSRN